MKRFLSLFYTVLFVFLLGCSIETFTYAKEKPVSLENTPIDVVYCYADLWDHTLRRGELDNSIKKDYDNQELKYSLRSVLKNIPWVRKIFIIMPNDKVRFLKDPEEISDKIVYVKNEDLLGFDTNSPYVKQFNMWKLREKFGCSNHVIYMDDDWFIGKPMKKSDFFYIDNNRVVPYVFEDKVQLQLGFKNPQKVTLKEVENRLARIKSKDGGQHPEADAGRGKKFFTLSFLMKDVLKQDSIRLVGTSGMGGFHYPFGIRLDELKELHGFIDKSKYAQATLYAKRRDNGTLYSLSAYHYYTLNKYSRKVRCPSTRAISLAKCSSSNFDVDLFVINNNPNEYLANVDLAYRVARNTMKRLFPEPTPYEIPNCKLDIFDFDEGAPKTRVVHSRSKLYLKRK